MKGKTMQIAIALVRLCNLVNNPAYVHIESTNIDEAIALLAV